MRTFLTSSFFDKKSFKSIMVLAWPLILATCSNVIQQFVDKMFLGHYSQDALAACVPAGMVSCAITVFFTGTVSYVSNFIAQFRGAKEYDKIPIILNQGFILSVVFGIICFFLGFAGNFLFETVAKHNADLVALELEYFRPLLYFAFLGMLFCWVSSFFIGIEKSDYILYANIIATVVNIILDYIFIFGKFGCPEMGLGGAAYATMIASAFGCIFLIIILFSRKYNEIYNTRSKIKFEYNSFKKLVHYGMPSGVQITMDFLIWTVFILIIGKFSIAELAASNIAFQVDQIAFMPIIGVGAAVSILIANELGKEEQKSLGLIISTAVIIATLYNFLIVLLFLFLPKMLIMPFIDFSSSNSELIKISVILLKILSVYIVFDGCGIIFSSVLRGSGDTMFIMWTMFISGLFLIIGPAIISLKINNIYFAWCGACAYIICLSIIFFFRVKNGKWKKIKIIS